MKPAEIEYRLIKQAYDAGASKEGTRQQKREAAITALKYTTAQARTERMWAVYVAGRKLLAQLAGNRTVTDLLSSYTEIGASLKTTAGATPDVIMSTGETSPISTPPVIRGTVSERSEKPEQRHLSDSVRDALEGYV